MEFVSIKFIFWCISACHLKKQMLVWLVLMCYISTALGGPLLDTSEMVDKDGVVHRRFPLLISNWCQNPEKPTDTCPRRDLFMKLKIEHCHYKCSAGEKVLCMESDLGMVFFCIPENTSCVEGIWWQVEDIVDRGTESFVLVKESACPNGYYQSQPSKCYNACKTKHAPLDKIPKEVKIYADGNNINTTLVRCNHDKGFYNAYNKSFISFDESFPIGFCTHVNFQNPCKDRQIPLYNGTCVNHCGPGFIRDDTDFLCKLNGTVGSTGKTSTRITESETVTRKEQGGGNGVQGNSNDVPWTYIITGFVVLLFVIVALIVKAFIFPNKLVPSCSYIQVHDSEKGSEVSSEESTKDADKDSEGGQGTSMDSLPTSDDSQSSLKQKDGENEGDSLLNEERPSANDLDETCRKEYMKIEAEEKTDSLKSSTPEGENVKDSTIDEESASEPDGGETNPVTSSSAGNRASSTRVKKKAEYKNSLFVSIEKVETINFGNNKDDQQDLLRCLCDQLDISGADLDRLLNTRNDSEQVKRAIEAIKQNDETDIDESMTQAEGGDLTTGAEGGDMTPLVAGDLTLAKGSGAGQEFASPINKTLTQLLVIFFAEYMKSVGALIYKDEYIGTVFRVGDDYVITAKHVIRRIIDPCGTGFGDFTLIETDKVFINFNASVCGETGYIYRVRHVLSSDTVCLDYTVLQITNGNDALPKGLKLGKGSVNFEHTKILHGIGYGDPEKTSCKVLDHSCPVIPSLNARILECEKWLHESIPSVADVQGQNVSLNAQNGQNATFENKQNRLEYFRRAVEKMGSDPNIVNKAYQGIARKQYIFLDIVMQHRGSGSPFLTSDGLVEGILTHGHPDFFYLLPKEMQAVFPSDKRFERLLKSEYVYENIYRRDPDLAQKLFG